MVRDEGAWSVERIRGVGRLRSSNSSQTKSEDSEKMMKNVGMLEVGNWTMDVEMF